MEYEIEHAVATDVGRVREQNEDAWLAIPARRLFAVADGMGGHAAGEVASRLAVETLAEEEGGSAAESPQAARSALERAVVDAGRRIHEEAARVPERHGMGTTVTALRFLDAGRAILVHVGDSRAYRLRGDGLERLTRDHTWVQEQVDRGILTETGARGHPAAGVLTRALGTESSVRPDVTEVDWRAGDLFLLCSDGLTAAVSEPEIERLLGRGGHPEEAARALVDGANRHGGPDNVTAIVLRVVEGPERGASPAHP